VLVAVNPYAALTKAGTSIYSPDVAWHFFKTEKVGLTPHIFKVSADAYGHLRDQVWDK
jgi:myosin heavy subunit